MTAAGEDPLGGLCASIALSHAAMAAQPPSTEEDSTFLPSSPAIPSADTAVNSSTIANLALEHDRLRALYEVIAARASGGERTQALASSAAQRARVAELLAIAGVEDLTQPAYDIPAASVSSEASRTATALEGEVALADAYAALLVLAAPQDREWLYSAALGAYRGAVVAGLTPEQVPALPGAVQPTPSPAAS
jgi:hypothetical protein